MFLSWFILVFAIFIVFKIYFIFNKKLSEWQEQVEQVQEFCNQFMATALQLVDELEEKKRHVDSIITAETNSNVFVPNQLNDCLELKQNLSVQGCSYSQEKVDTNKIELYQQIREMIEDGKNISMVAKELNMGVGELQLILSLSNKNYKLVPISTEEMI